MSRVFKPSEINFSLSDIPSRTEPRIVLLCTPDYFDIVDVKNVHMQGHVGGLNKPLAIRQWQDLKSVYISWKEKDILKDVVEIQGVEGLEDMVFTANQSFPWLVQGKKVVIMSKMRHASREREVPYFRVFYQNLGYELLELNTNTHFEGMGDLIPHYGKNLLYGGYGHRTDETSYREISNLLHAPIILLRLEDPRFYHLDTCFIPVDEDTLLLTPTAFRQDDLKQLSRLFKNIIEIPDEEASRFFALNAHLVNDKKSGQKTAVLQKGTTVMKNQLTNLGFEISEIDTSEYIKSGGSVFCMKMMVY